MAVPQPLFTDAQLTGVPQTLPDGIYVAANPSHMVRLTLSTGETVTFGTVANMMRLITKMRREGQHIVCPQEDVFVALAGATKLIIGEQTFQNQKLLNSGCFCYSQGKLEVRMRSGSCVNSLDEALACVGHYRLSANPYDTTAELLVPQGVASPRLIVVDYRYTESGGGTTFVDNPPLQERPPVTEEPVDPAAPTGTGAAAP